MPLFKKKLDPLTDRSKELAREIAALEAEIQKLNSRPEPRPSPAPANTPSAPSLRSSVKANDPVFEEVKIKQLASHPEAESTSGHYNDLGVRKYDLPALWRRIRNHFYGPPPPNPKLINYLAAGSIHGIRPLRYESRIARNRFFVFAILLAFILWGVIAMFLRYR
jgi:hypothetical protein